VKPQLRRLRVLYLFAGIERKADLGDSITKVWQEESKHRGLDCELEVVCVDILRDGVNGDLLNNHRQSLYLAQILEGDWDLVLAAPPCNTFSRALFHDKMGPPPLRDRASPWGHAGLSLHLAKKLSEANSLVKFALQALEAAANCSSKTVGAWLEFPEDLGDARFGSPASLWQLTEARDLEQLRFYRGALNQCEWGNTKFAKPTGILTNVAGFVSDADFHAGWPIFEETSSKKLSYIGPLPRNCAHGSHPPLIGPKATGGWNTASSAAYPPMMCEKLAKIFAKHLADSLTGQVQSTLPAGGGLGHSAPYLYPHDLFAEEIKEIEQILDKDPLKFSRPSSRSSLSLGFRARTGPKDLSREDVAVVNRVIGRVAARMGIELLWSSLQVNINAMSGWHVDPTTGPALVLAGGSFTGGELDFGAKGSFALQGQALLFKEGQTHRVRNFQGCRWSIVAYVPIRA
jgi:hypothetical protein